MLYGASLIAWCCPQARQHGYSCYTDCEQKSYSSIAGINHDQRIIPVVLTHLAVHILLRGRWRVLWWCCCGCSAPLKFGCCVARFRLKACLVDDLTCCVCAGFGTIDRHRCMPPPCRISCRAVVQCGRVDGEGR